MTAGRKPLWAPPALNLRLSDHHPDPNPNPNPNPTPIIIQTPSPPNQSRPTILDLHNHLITSLRSLLPSPSRPPRPSPPPSSSEPGCAIPLFRPYVAKLPWHGGIRAFLSQLFPRYGHYCGPNWSSGKAGGSMLWDRRPIDWLDFCCYCHDIGYDSHDQAKLLKADLQFLQCLERPRMATKGGAIDSLFYRAMCITGLRHILIPYRRQLVKLQAGPSFGDLVGNFIGGRRNSGNTIIRQ